MAQITIKDIARQLNISPSTVSRALRGHPDISPKTRELVVAQAAKYNYRPNLIAQSLQNQRTNTIGVIVPEIRHFFFSSAISGIEMVSYEYGYNIMVCQSHENFEREVINTQALVSNQVAGLLISIAQETRSTDHLKAVINHGIPLVFFDRAAEGLKASKVVVDDYHGAYNAVEYLIRSGYRRIAHLAGPRHISISKHRMEGYRQALKDNNIRLEKNLVVPGGFGEEDGRAGVRKLLALKKPPTAVFAVNDPVAIGAYAFIKESGLKIPGDIALVGFSNNPVSSLIEPPLLTVDQPAFEMGRTAAALLLEQIQSPDQEFVPQTRLLKTSLIVRESA